MLRFLQRVATLPNFGHEKLAMLPKFGHGKLGRDVQNEKWSTTTTTTTQSTCEERPQPQLDLITHPNNNINTIFVQ